MKEKLEEKTRAKQESGKKLNKLNNRLQKMEAANAELKTALKTERSKSLVARIFNR